MKQDGPRGARRRERHAQRQESRNRLRAINAMYQY
jgi:hypothetical protein